MYQNIFIKRNKTNVEVHLWDDETGYLRFNHKSYAYLNHHQEHIVLYMVINSKKLLIGHKMIYKMEMYLNQMFH